MKYLTAGVDAQDLRDREFRVGVRARTLKTPQDLQASMATSGASLTATSGMTFADFCPFLLVVVLLFFSVTFALAEPFRFLSAAGILSLVPQPASTMRKV